MHNCHQDEICHISLLTQCIHKPFLSWLRVLRNHFCVDSVYSEIFFRLIQSLQENYFRLIIQSKKLRNGFQNWPSEQVNRMLGSTNISFWAITFIFMYTCYTEVIYTHTYFVHLKICHIQWTNYLQICIICSSENYRTKKRRICMHISYALYTGCRFRVWVWGGFIIKSAYTPV